MSVDAWYAAVGAAFIALALAGEPLSRLINRHRGHQPTDQPDTDQR